MQTLYHRRKREADCVVGDQPKAQEKIVKNCQCTASDFEWYVPFSRSSFTYAHFGCSEFNHVRDDSGACVLMSGEKPRNPDPAAQCRGGEDYWYELTPYRKIPYSSCEGGNRIDRGPSHPCPGVRGHGFFFWLMMIFIPVAFAGLAGYWYTKRGGYSRG